MSSLVRCNLALPNAVICGKITAMEKPMKIVVRAFWDDVASVWVAVADGELGLVTEAKTIEELSRKLPVIAKDLLGGEHEGPIDIEILTTTALEAAE
jgi:Domain of unknown function (DUF1902)